MCSGVGYNLSAVQLYAVVYVFGRFSLTPMVRFLILGFSGMVFSAVSLQAISNRLYFVLALFVGVVSCRGVANYRVVF